MAAAPRNRKNAEPELAEELVGDETGTVQLFNPQLSSTQLTYAKVGELAIFEGDIVLGRHADLEAQTEMAAGDVAFAVAITVSATAARWPNATVPYEIDAGMPDQFRVTDAIAHWTANTPIRFVQRTGANAGQYPNYVRFFAGDGCYSTVGMAGGRQDISLGSGCGTGNAIHEIGHTVGLWHEQSREDRDSFVTINWANIDPGKAHNFDQHISDGDDIGAYDYGSIMHYPATAFSTNGQPTIVPIQAGVVIGQRTGLSAGDIAGVRQMYPTIFQPFKKIHDDGGTVPFKKFRDDNIVIGGAKKVRDDNIVTPIKKIRDDNIVVVPKQIRDFQVGKPVGDIPRPPRPWEQLGQLGGLVGQLDQAGTLPFILANPHHADAAAAYEAANAGYGAYPADAADPATTQLLAAAQSAAVAAQALAEVSAALTALAGGQGA